MVVVAKTVVAAKVKTAKTVFAALFNVVILPPFLFAQSIYRNAIALGQIRFVPKNSIDSSSSLCNLIMHLRVHLGLDMFKCAQVTRTICRITR